ncbi:CHASE2 domain-containing protein [Thalassotalea litorea]|uniref:CHASE2 domain-containing protein n=1 Tax=Thalassotalea litorea TaxID=2020715 RepID=UPI003735180B
MKIYTLLYLKNLLVKPETNPTKVIYAFGFSLIVAYFLSILLLVNKDKISWALPYEHWLQDIMFTYLHIPAKETINGHHDIPTSVIAFDDYSYQKTGRPSQIPREEIANIIASLTDGKSPTKNARFLALDIDLSANSSGLVTSFSRHDEKISSALKGTEASQLLVFLSRSFAYPIELNNAQQIASTRSNNKLPYWDPAWIDSLVENQNNVFFTSTNYLASSDAVRRKFSHSEFVCKNDVIHWIPAMSLLLASAKLNEEKHTNKEIIEHLESQINLINEQVSQVKCSDFEKRPKLTYESFCKLNNQCIESFQLDIEGLHNVHLTSEFSRFYFETYPPEKGTQSNIRMFSMKNVNESGWYNQLPISSTLLLGATYTNSQDYHSVPGYPVTIPGIYLIVNSTSSITKYPSQQHAPLLVHAIFYLCLYLVLFGLFLKSESSLFSLIAIPALLALHLAVSICVSHWGYHFIIFIPETMISVLILVFDVIPIATSYISKRFRE